jgi:acylphosphatase
VQGVGFRYTVRRIAQALAVTGFVRNLDDGRVELVVEGSAADIDSLMSSIQSAMADNIHDLQTATAPATGQFASFEITS